MVGWAQGLDQCSAEGREQRIHIHSLGLAGAGLIAAADRDLPPHRRFDLR